MISDKLTPIFQIPTSRKRQLERQVIQVAQNKHATEARTASREEVTFVKRQLEKPVFQVIQQNKHTAEARTASHEEVTFVKRQLEKPVFQVVQQTSMLWK